MEQQHTFEQLLHNLLTNGEIHIGTHYSVMHVALIEKNKSMHLVRSDRGVKHAVYLLMEKYTGETRFRTEGDSLYRYPLGSGLDEINRILSEDSYVVSCVGKTMYISQRTTKVPYLGMMPGTYLRRTRGKSFEEAVIKIPQTKAILI